MRHEISKNYDDFIISTHSSTDLDCSTVKFPDLFRLNSVKKAPDLRDLPISLANERI